MTCFFLGNINRGMSYLNIKNNTSSHKTKVNGLNLYYVSCGIGPLVIFIHGFPETHYSWRHQLPAIAKAGYRAVALDVRGYGNSDAPHPIAAYSMKTITTDISELIKALGEKEAVLVGHDWGAPIAWNTAVLYPKQIKAVAGLSVPYVGRGPMPMIDLFKELYKDRFFYQLYFQKEGVAEAELEADIKKSLFLTYLSSDARGMKRILREKKSASFTTLNSQKKTSKQGFLDGLPHYKNMPYWLTKKDLDIFANAFKKSGFRGPINRYRVQNQDWHELKELTLPFTKPACFIAGNLDPVNFFIPESSKERIKRIKSYYTDLRIFKLLNHVGHWTSQEAPEAVNTLLIQFLKTLAHK